MEECPGYAYLYERLKQQEETIAQLVQIIGSTNRKVIELHKFHMGMEHQILRETPASFPPSN